MPEYWIVNLADRALEVYRDPQPTPSEGWRYAAVDVLQPPTSVRPLGTPDSVIAVADLLP